MSLTNHLLPKGVLFVLLDYDGTGNSLMPFGGIAVLPAVAPPNSPPVKPSDEPSDPVPPKSVLSALLGVEMGNKPLEELLPNEPKANGVVVDSVSAFNDEGRAGELLSRTLPGGVFGAAGFLLWAPEPESVAVDVVRRSLYGKEAD
ncbi:hypothetical protein LZ32DRAFT_599561 [Colletotrichum eremochloae]|nr:hypothetical protein LZ32DRAFT_599561 [Colletotrichum eremochloae]